LDAIMWFLLRIARVVAARPESGPAAAVFARERPPANHKNELISALAVPGFNARTGKLAAGSGDRLLRQRRVSTLLGPAPVAIQPVSNSLLFIDLHPFGPSMSHRQSQDFTPSRVIPATVATAGAAATVCMCVSMAQGMCCCMACARSNPRPVWSS